MFIIHFLTCLFIFHIALTEKYKIITAREDDFYHKVIEAKCTEARLYCSKRKSGNYLYFSPESKFRESVSKQNCYACAKAKKKKKKAMPLRHSAYIPSSVKSP